MNFHRIYNLIINNEYIQFSLYIFIFFIYIISILIIEQQITIDEKDFLIEELKHDHKYEILLKDKEIDNLKKNCEILELKWQLEIAKYSKL